ncbi:MAG: hypothetical protein ACXWT8_07125 [Methylobacter sp.]
MIGKRFSELLVISRAGNVKGRVVWRCKCDCGKTVDVQSKRLKNGMTKSCGCRRSSVSKSLQTKHGMYGTPTYNSWAGVIQRCNNENSISYKRYGGRGIFVCERWMSFENFFEDMGERPEGMTLDRKDNDGNYESENCRWATRKEQANNTRRNRFVNLNGKSVSIKEAAKIRGIRVGLIYERVNAGLSVDDALNKPVDERFRNNKDQM